MLSNANREDILHLKQLETGTAEKKLICISAILMCVLFYFILNMVIIRISRLGEGYYIVMYGYKFSRYTISGIIAQGQVIAVILITLNPLKYSNIIALLLCTSTVVAALFNVIASRNTTALPGIVIPITSAGISIVISSYARNLKRQMGRVLEYSQIVNKDEELLHTLAYYDALTGLPNRKKILDQIDALTNPESHNIQCFELVYLDLDNFKKINDTMGHSIGDAILKQVAERWRAKCHPEDMLGRVGGDEFIILIRHKQNEEELSAYLKGFGEALKSSIIVERKEFFVSASYGITRYPADAKSGGELIKNADIALYRAKNLGKNNYMFFNKQMQEDVSKRIQLENGLLGAIRNNELFMVFQPQYESKSGKLRGYEALVRWKHPELGLVSPMEFIPIAEETGVIIEIGRWIIETVLYQFMEIKRKWDMRVVVSINISVAQMLEPSFIHMIKVILLETGYDSNYLEFEITESVFITSPEYITEVIRQLKAMGIRIALDDFGTGYASLNYLQMLPVNILKMDKAFIDNIDTKHSRNKMVAAIISLSHKLGIEVIAEGVEIEEQLDYLIENKCDYIQGYLLGKPMAESEICKTLGFGQTG